MLAKRIIPCLDVCDGKVVKGLQFKNHQIVGDIVPLAEFYSNQGADELVFYDITASGENRLVDTSWVSAVAEAINIPFTVAGGIRSVDQAKQILYAGADKISVNSPALEKPELINQLAERFGSQCVVVGIDSMAEEQNFWIWQYTGSVEKSRATQRATLDWVQEVQARGAGEIVLNCMRSDGQRTGYDLNQLQQVRAVCNLPLIASGGAGKVEHFCEVFHEAAVDGALAASIFHQGVVSIQEVKKALKNKQIPVRLADYF